MTTTLPKPLIDMEVCLGVGQTDTSGVWDSAVWDVNTWSQTDTSLGDWVDVTCEVLDGFELGAGATSVDGVVTRWEAATCALTLKGAQFNPRTGPYAGLMGPGLPIRVRWRPAGSEEWLTAFSGYVDDDGFTYETKGTPVPTAALSCTDGTRIFAAFDGVEQPLQGQGETAAERVTRIADMVGWPAELRDISTGGVTVRDTTLAQNAWTMLLNVSDTDLALLWVNREGKLAYRPQGRVIPQHEIAAVVMCGPEVEGTTTITPVNISGQQPNVTRNIVSISRQGQSGEEPATVTIRDESSIARYLPHSYSRTDLIHVDDAWSMRVAEAVLAGSAWPSTAPERIELDSRADLASTAILLGLEPSLSISVSDGVGSWLCEPAGWKVNVYRDHISGEVELLDVTTYAGATWDNAAWDIDRWAF